MHLHIKENITLVQDKVSLYYFGGKYYKHLEINLAPKKFLKIVYKINKACENMVKDVFFK
jgi:hypothetical protein